MDPGKFEVKKVTLAELSTRLGSFVSLPLSTAHGAKDTPYDVSFPDPCLQ
jgi:hypothetical protein